MNKYIIEEYFIDLDSWINTFSYLKPFTSKLDAQKELKNYFLDMQMQCPSVLYSNLRITKLLTTKWGLKND